MIVPRWKWAKWREVITHVRCRWLSLWGEASAGQARHVGDVLRPILFTLANCTIDNNLEAALEGIVNCQEL